MLLFKSKTMARQPKLRIKFTEQSLLENLQQMYLALSDKIAKCNRQMTLLTNLIVTPSDAITLQNVLANVEKAITNCYSQRIEIIKIQKDMVTTNIKKEDKKKIETNNSLSEEQIIAMQRRFADLKKQSRTDDGNEY
jgi:hypothetical protein